MTSSLEQFHKHCKKRGVPKDDYQVVCGFFNESLFGSEAEQLPTNIALAYIDCDMYSSTKDVLKFLVPRFKHGMILAFDDYFLYSPSQISGERRALLEAMNEINEWNLLPYMQFALAGMSFIVEKRSLIEI